MISCCFSSTLPSTTEIYTLSLHDALPICSRITTITTDPFLVYTSNVFAILGLRSMYFLLADVMGRLRFLKAGLALILTFVGAKMLLSPVVTVPPAASLGVIGGVLAVTVGASLLLPAPASARVPGGVRER